MRSLRLPLGLTTALALSVAVATEGAFTTTPSKRCIPTAPATSAAAATTPMRSDLRRPRCCTRVASSSAACASSSWSWQAGRNMAHRRFTARLNWQREGKASLGSPETGKGAI